MASSRSSSGKFPNLHDLMNTPGLNTGDPSTWPKRLAPESVAEASKAFNMAMEPIEEVDHVLADLRDEINDKIANHPNHPILMLTGPDSLTVVSGTSKYSKSHHMGGEEFRISHCYVGKRNRMIYVFTPRAVTSYKGMEMLEIEAKQKLAGFTEFLATIEDGKFQRKRNELLKNESAKKVEQEVASMIEKYESLGFASW